MKASLRLGVLGFVVLTCCTSPAQPPLPDTSAAVTNQRRHELGVQNGPDSLAAVVETGQGWITLFSGTNSQGTRGTFRFLGVPWESLRPDPILPGSGPPVPRPVLLPGSADPIPRELGGLYTIQGTYNGFDRDYAGGGTALLLDQRLFYFYHGENSFRKDPGGKVTGSSDGWSGIGVAEWDPARLAFRKCGQILGLSEPNGVDARGNHPEQSRQRTPSSDEANVVYDPAADALLLYYSDMALPGTQVSVARLGRADFLKAIEAHQVPAFKKYYQGSFSQPALTSQGQGGLSSPLLEGRGYRSPHVLRLAHRKLFVMVVGEKHQTVWLRTSEDGLRWSAGTPVAQGPDGASLLYPSVYLPDPNNESEVLVLYTQVATQKRLDGKPRHDWSNASLQQRRVRINPPEPPAR